MDHHHLARFQRPSLGIDGPEPYQVVPLAQRHLAETYRPGVRPGPRLRLFRHDVSRIHLALALDVSLDGLQGNRGSNRCAQINKGPVCLQGPILWERNTRRTQIAYQHRIRKRDAPPGVAQAGANAVSVAGLNRHSGLQRSSVTVHLGRRSFHLLAVDDQGCLERIGPTVVGRRRQSALHHQVALVPALVQHRRSRQDQRRRWGSVVQPYDLLRLFSRHGLGAKKNACLPAWRSIVSAMGRSFAREPVNA